MLDTCVSFCAPPHFALQGLSEPLPAWRRGLISATFISHSALLQSLVNLVRILNDACTVLGVCV